MEDADTTNVAGTTCAICLERIQDDPNRMYGILENCDHTFCLTCIRRWRSSSQQNRLMCPQCRTLSHLVIPSRHWFNNPEEKQRMIREKLDEWSRKPCRFYRGGLGFCRYNDNCRFLHARNPDLAWNENSAEDPVGLYDDDVTCQDWVDVFARESDGYDFYIPVVMDNHSSVSTVSLSDREELNDETVDLSTAVSDTSRERLEHPMWSSTEHIDAWSPEVDDYMLENDAYDHADIFESELVDDDASIDLSNIDEFEDGWYEGIFIDNGAADSLSSSGSFSSEAAPNSVGGASESSDDEHAWVDSDAGQSTSDTSGSSTLYDETRLNDDEHVFVSDICRSERSYSTTAENAAISSQTSGSSYDSSEVALSSPSSFSSSSSVRTNSVLTESSTSENENTSSDAQQTASLSSDSSSSTDDAPRSRVMMLDDLVVKLDVLDCAEGSPRSFSRKRRP